MQRFIRGVCLASLFVAGMTGQAQAQKVMTWEEVKARFEASNPILRAGQIGIDESKAGVITAYLRPRSNITVLLDQVDLSSVGPSRPSVRAFRTGTVIHLQERQGNLELRWASAQKAADGEYRYTQLNDFNFLGSILIAAGHRNLAVGHEALQ